MGQARDPQLPPLLLLYHIKPLSHTTQERPRQLPVTTQLPPPYHTIPYTRRPGYVKRKMVTVEEVRKAQRADGPATVMAIGTATPPNCVEQSTYPDYYFRITNSEHKTELKEKFKRMCKGSAPSILPILFLLFL